MIAKNKKVHGQIDVLILFRMIDALSSLNPDSQSICNAFNGLGSLALHQNLSGTVHVDNLAHLFRLLSQQPLTRTFVHELYLCLYSVYDLLKSDQLRGKLEQELLEPLLTLAIRSKSFVAKEISNIIYFLGELAIGDKINGKFLMPQLNNLLEQLTQTELKDQDISSAIYGLGQLAKMKQVSGIVDANKWQPLLSKLLKTRAQPLAIANTLYGLSELTKSHQLMGVVDWSELDPLVDALLQDHSEPQNISQFIYSVGILAKSKSLNDFVPLHRIYFLLTALTEKKPESLSIANALYGLSELAKTDQFDETIDASLLQALLIHLSQNQNIHHISISIYALGELAKHGKLNGFIEISVLNPLLNILSEGRIEAHYISNTIYGLGELAGTDQLDGQINMNLLNQLLEKLPQTSPSEQNISNTLLGLGHLTRKYKLQDSVSGDAVRRSIDILSVKDPLNQNISNAFNGLGILARSRKLNAEIDSIALNKLIQILLNNDPSAIEISYVFFALGELAVHDQLKDVLNLNSSLFETLIKKLLLKEPNAYDISLSILGLGQLKQSGIHIENQTDLDALVNLMNFPRYKFLDLKFTLTGLTHLKYRGHQKLTHLFNAIFNLSYLHLSPTIEFLDLYATHLKFNPDLDVDIFERLKSNLVLPFNRFNSNQQLLLTQILDALPTPLRESLRFQLELKNPQENETKQFMEEDVFQSDAEEQIFPEPKSRLSVDLNAAPAHHPAARLGFLNNLARNKKSFSKNKDTTNLTSYKGGPVFNAIRDENIAALEELLSIKSPSPKSQPSSNRNNGSEADRSLSYIYSKRHKSARKKQNANEMVQYFLHQTHPEILKELIKTSKFDYFERILRACSKHLQYQFAINHDLNPIILYLSTSQLYPMIREFINLGFYQDHRAILSLVEALFLRKQNSRHPTELIQMQKILLKRAIDFHQQHHHRITPKLTDALYRIEENNEQLFPEDETEDACTPLISTKNSLLPQNLRAQEPKISRITQELPGSFSIFSRPSSMVLTKFREDPLRNSDGSVNMNAKYSTEQLQKILNFRLLNLKNLQFILLAAIDFHQEPTIPLIQNQLLEFFAENKFSEYSWIILPICIHEHWVGISIYVKNEAVILTYYDSLESSPYKDLVISTSTLALTEIFNPKLIESQYKSHYKQNDDTSCGVYLIENIYNHLSGAIPKRLNIETWREKHLELIELNKNTNRLKKRKHDEPHQTTAHPMKK